MTNKLKKNYFAKKENRSLEWDVSTAGIICGATHITNALNTALQSCNTNLTKSTILSLLDENYGEMSQRQLIKKFPFPVTEQALTIALNHLEQENCIKRVPAADDKRAKILVMEDKGAELLSKSNAVRSDVMGKLKNQFTKEELLSCMNTIEKFSQLYIKIQNEYSDI